MLVKDKPHLQTIPKDMTINNSMLISTNGCTWAQPT